MIVSFGVGCVPCGRGVVVRLRGQLHFSYNPLIFICVYDIHEILESAIFQGFAGEPLVYGRADDGSRTRL